MTMPDPNAPPLTPITSAQNEKAAVSRHAISFAAGIFTVAGALAVIPADQAAKAVQAVQDIGSHVKAIFGDIYVLVPIVTTGFSVLMAWKAKFAASLPGQLRSIARNPDVDIKPQSKIVVPPPVAAAVPIPQVAPPS